MNFGAPFKKLKNLKVECKCDSYMLPANISTFLRDAETIDAEYIKMGERSEEGIVGNYIFIFLFLFAVWILIDFRWLLVFSINFIA